MPLSYWVLEWGFKLVLSGILAYVVLIWSTDWTLFAIIMIKSLAPYLEVLEIMMGNLYLESDFGPYVMRILSSEGD